MSWMAWTMPTALFFVSIVCMLVTMTVLELNFPTTVRKGLLPIATTRGDRMFIWLLSAAFIHLAWLAVGFAIVWPATVISMLWLAALMRWG